VALYHLHLTEDQFWQMTPRQFVALRDQHKVRIRHDELLSAIIAASVVNTSMCAPEKSIPFASFMPSEWAKQPIKRPRKKRISKRERDLINQNVHCFFAARVLPTPKES